MTILVGLLNKKSVRDTIRESHHYVHRYYIDPDYIVTFIDIAMIFTDKRGGSLRKKSTQDNEMVGAIKQRDTPQLKSRAS